VSIPARLPAAYESAGIVQVGLLGFGQWGFGSEKSARDRAFAKRSKRLVPTLKNRRKPLFIQ
jgi:hypothetical protein